MCTDKFSCSRLERRARRQQLRELTGQVAQQSLEGAALLLPLWTVFSAVAIFRANKAHGLDGIPLEALQALPTVALFSFWQAMQRRLWAVDNDVPHEWRRLHLVGVPKPEGFTDLSKLRWLCLQSSLKKLLLCATRFLLREQIAWPAEACLYGFRPGCAVSDVLQLLRQLVHHGGTWDGSSLVLGSLDIATAFDLLSHTLVREALSGFGVHPAVTLVLLQELMQCSAQLEVPTAGTIPDIPCECGGCQGGVDTPDAFNAAVAWLLGPLAASWKIRGYGLRAEQAVVTHVVWADNFWVVAANWEQFGVMVQELVTTFESRGFRWKESSLQYLPVAVAAPPTLFVPTGPSSGYTFQRVEQLEALGSTVFGPDAPADAALTAQLDRATRMYWAVSRFFTPRTTVKQRLTAWATTVRACALAAAEAHTWTPGALQKLKSWELKLLRRLLRLRPRHAEDIEYRTRSAAIVRRHLRKAGCSTAYEVALRGLHRAAHREQRTQVPPGPLLQAFRTQRSRAHWQAVQALATPAQRRREGYQQRRQGHVPYWEDLLCGHYGVNWRQQSTTLDERSWRALEDRFVHDTCHRLQLWTAVQPRGPRAVQAECPDKGSKAMQPEFADPARCPPMLTAMIQPTRTAHCTLLIQSDNETIAHSFLAKAVVEDPAVRTYISRALDNLYVLYQLGISPGSTEGHYFCWSPRSENGAADWCANHVLARGVDFDYESRRYLGSDLFLQCDGGFQRGCGATGVAAFDRNTGANINLRGRLYASIRSSAEAEASACWLATCQAVQLVRRYAG